MEEANHSFTEVLAKHTTYDLLIKLHSVTAYSSVGFNNKRKLKSVIISEFSNLGIHLRNILFLTKELLKLVYI